METNWVTISAADVDAYLVAPQSTAIRSALLQNGQSAPFDTIMPDMAALMRAKIGNQFAISALPNSVPPEARFYLIALTLEALSARISTLKISDQQQKFIDRAWAWLDSLTKGTEAITLPTDAITPQTQNTAGTKLLNSRVNQATPEEMNGL